MKTINNLYFSLASFIHDVSRSLQLREEDKQSIVSQNYIPKQANYVKASVDSDQTCL